MADASLSIFGIKFTAEDWSLLKNIRNIKLWVSFRVASLHRLILTTKVELKVKGYNKCYNKLHRIISYDINW